MRSKWLTIIGTGILAVAITMAALAASPIKLVVNGQEITPDVPPQVVNGRTMMVPVRWVAEALGAQVEWDAAAREVRVSTGQTAQTDGPFDPAEVYTAEDPVVKRLAIVEVPAYVPTYLPGEGPFGIVNLRVDRNGYDFTLIREREQPGVTEERPWSEADVVASVSAASYPPARYPLEEQLLAQPAGDVDLNGVTTRSYGEGMMLTWSDSNWEYTALGRAPGDGSRVAGEILQALPEGNSPIAGVLGGRMRAEQTGNVMHVTASWTYDGKIWYTLNGRGGPEDTLKIAASMKLLKEVNPNSSGASVARITLDKYLRVLQETASNRYGGYYPSPEAQAEAFRSPYSFLSSGLQQEYPFDEYRSRLDPVANLQMLQLWEAPGHVDPDAPSPTAQRFFVELKTVENLAGKTAQVYYSGYVTLGQEGDGWRITKAEVQPENLTWQIGGHQPWRAEPASVAIVTLAGERVPVNEDPQASQVTKLDDGRAVVMVPTPGEKPAWHKVILVPLADVTWRALSWQ